MEKTAKENTHNILDIHTHNPESDERSIYNYPLLSISPLYMPPTPNAKAEITKNFTLHGLISAKPSDEGLLHGPTLINEGSLKKNRFYSMGIHPWELSYENIEKQWERMSQLHTSKQIIAIGETGLDKLTQAPMDLQLVAFRAHVEAAEKFKLPLIIHCVKAMEELLAVKKEFRTNQPWIWHGFRGKPEQAKQLLKLGFYLSFGEYYPDESMVAVPLERLFLETDNSRLDIEILLQRAAKIRGVEVEALRETIQENVQNVFFKV
ncbi:TatD family hydrolase [Bacteroides sp.]|uniref:TatD family hydrolase n=1 Tax=Bacteroides sp. TaxID=29523 RepID=UPI002618AC60|nr:TatD family hydrolase [Bacteroides sp.]MDD3036452.1 TatD family hydrolase [Bacteroides sp.]